MCISQKIDDIAKLANFGDNGDREVKLGSLGGGKDDEHNGNGSVVISEIFAMQDAFYFGIGSRDIV